jgi:hypothetical protein
MSNKVILSILLVNLSVIATFGFFYSRDVLNQDSGDKNISGCIPHNLRIVNLEKNSYTVEWNTEDECLGYTKYGKSISEQTDIASSTNGYTPSNTHKVIVDGLKPEENYYFVVYSNGEYYGNDGKPLEVKTLGL